MSIVPPIAIIVILGCDAVVVEGCAVVESCDAVIRGGSSEAALLTLATAWR